MFRPSLLSRVFVDPPPSSLEFHYFIGLGDIGALRLNLSLIYRLGLYHLELVKVVELARDLSPLVASEAAGVAQTLQLTDLHEDALDGVRMAYQALGARVLALLLLLLLPAYSQALDLMSGLFQAPLKLDALLLLCYE